MLNEFQIASEASPKIWIAAFLSTDKQGWAYTGLAQVLDSSSQSVAAKPGMDNLFGYQAVQVNRQEFENSGGIIGLSDHPVTVFQGVVGRCVFMEDANGQAYKFSGGKGDGKFYDGMTINRTTDIKLLAGDKIVNRFGTIVGEVVDLPKLSKAVSAMQIGLRA